MGLNWNRKWGFITALAVLAFLLGTTCTPAPRYRAGKTKPEVRKRHSVSHPRVQVGVASYYGRKFHGRKTANGERFDMYALTAAHRTFPFGTRLRVTNLANGRQVVVRVNDRGPFIKGRIIDLSYGAAQKLGMIGMGTAWVKIEVLKLGGTGK